MFTYGTCLNQHNSQTIRDMVREAATYGTCLNQHNSQTERRDGGGFGMYGTCLNQHNSQTYVIKMLPESCEADSSSAIENAIARNTQQYVKNLSELAVLVKIIL